MEEMTSRRDRGIPFNSPVETGLRSVSILAPLYPAMFDLQRMVAFDYLVVHSGDVGGPPSLHPDLPMRNAELLVRRDLVERGLLVMMTRQLVERTADGRGILYRAGEMAGVFLSSLTSDYMALLQQRARWVAERFGGMPDDEFNAIMRANFDKWVDQFHVLDTGLSGRLA
jgi:hypothetical protein